MKEFPQNIPENTNGPDKAENKVEKPLTKEGVDFVFEQYPEIVSLGTKEQYSEYLDTVFPESKIKNIVYHGGEKGISTFNTERSIKKLFFGAMKKKEVGAYFTNKIETAKNYKDLKSLFKGEDSSEIYPVILLAKNPYVINSRLDNRDNILKIRSEFISENEKNKLFKNGYDSVIRDYEYVVFDPSQTHILGSDSDIEKFKEFVTPEFEQLKSKYVLDIRGIVRDRLRQEQTIDDNNFNQEESKANPNVIWDLVIQEDIEKLLEAYQENKRKQLEEFEQFRGKFNPDSGNFTSEDTSFYNKKIDDMKKLQEFLLF